MSVNKVTIKCPYCAALLSVANSANLDNKIMKCPVCTKTSPFKSYIRMGNRNSAHMQYKSDETQYEDKNTRYEYADNALNDPLTSFGKNNAFILGELQIVNSNMSYYRLKMGQNIIGRKADSSKADFQIPVNGSTSRISREHLIIDVNRVEGKGFVHNISLYKQQVNDTFVNDEKVYFGESLVLHHGDIIKLPDEISIEFIISDSERTRH